METYTLTSRESPSQRLIGAWTLADAEFYEGKDRVFLFGRSPCGLLIYSESEWISVHLGRCDRHGFRTGDQLTADDWEIRRAFTTYISYFGRFTVDEEMRTATHIVTGSLFPDLQNTDQERRFRFTGQTLTLETTTGTVPEACQ